MPLAIVHLMHVAPDDPTNVRMRIDDLPKLAGIRQADAVEPATAHRDRMMMQTHQRVRGGVAQVGIETGEFGGLEPAPT